MAYAGKRVAMVAGDRRSITFEGDCSNLEEEIYSGGIVGDEELQERAVALKANIAVFDNREKVWQRGPVLIGEVTEISPTVEKRRRAYVTPGAFLLVQVIDGLVEISGEGSSSAIVLGNKITRKVAEAALARARGRLDENLFRSIFSEARRRSASVSPDCSLIQIREAPPRPKEALVRALDEDCRAEGWKLCVQR